MGGSARRLLRPYFLVMRHLCDYLTLMVALKQGAGYLIDLHNRRQSTAEVTGHEPR